jgi:hypothetical protein
MMMVINLIIITTITILLKGALQKFQDILVVKCNEKRRGNIGQSPYKDYVCRNYHLIPGVKGVAS